MDDGAVAAYRKAGTGSEKVTVVDSTAVAQPKVPAMASLRWAAIACGMLASMACSGALASDPVEDAFSLFAQERDVEARKAIEQMLERNPDAPGVRLLYGVLNAREGNLVEAVAVFESLRNDHPSMFEAHNNLAVLYAKLDRLDDARKTLIAALELRPDAVVYANLGDVYMKLAERAYQRAHQLTVLRAAPSEGAEQRRAMSEPEATPVEPSAPPTTQDEPRVIATDSGEPESPEEPEEPPALASAETCIHAGWFEQSDAAYEAAAWMRARGAVEIQVRGEEQQIIKNYQVYLPPASSREAAAATARELREKGVDDLWIIDRGEQINGISLGVFRNKRYMSRRVAELEELDYVVLTTANMRTVTEYSVEARAGGDRSAFDDAWKTAFPEQPMRTIDCADRS